MALGTKQNLLKDRKIFYITVNDDIRIALLDEYHAEELFSLVDKNRNHLRSYMPWIDKTTKLQDTVSFIRAHKNRWLTKQGFDCGIFHRDELCGCVSLHTDHSIGYWLDEDYQGQNIAFLCVKKLVDEVFRCYGVDKIAIHCDVDNDRSRSIPLRLGFTEISKTHYIKKAPSD